MDVTIKDIAKVAGVSYSTVSKALRNSPLVKPQTKQKILQVAEQLGYEPNIAAKSLVSKKSNTIGVVWPTVERVALASLATKINDELEKRGYRMLLSINPIISAISIFNQIQVDAILVFNEQVSPYNIKSKNPVLFYGEPGPSPYPTFLVDRKSAIKKALEYLYQLGHREIVYVGDLSEKNKNQQEKFKGFKEGTEKLNLSSARSIAVNTKGLGWQDGYQAAKQILQNHPLTAIIGGGYDISLGVLRAVKEAGLTIPGDISLISYDNIPQAANENPSLTTVGPSVDKIAGLIAKSLLQLANEENLDTPALDAELIIRNSCAPRR
ncbi:LacI family DNA-binding transcriptional regulator [Paenactinomyces guangxiensis]|uniref:LacI family DNA-binding transcriptional regulator n=1 Tax=Paenactinomyces guangxiensis TaxID=1490290 RepID=A0A7W1WPL2_9BACL|nr:LacI family DNA-binding transcriptional regulator [Paenactinomyces guangxiensis]MBA4493571.1 LacI family DNA-binding transcriptional regulator [Paenactinomyces guangxiensis]MBH8590662.1 LacI family DNA-binding transcriptional regulator [Paenactinomyces guangxiensis]